MTKKHLPQIFADNLNKIGSTIGLDIDGEPCDSFVFSKLKEYNIHWIFRELYEMYSLEKKIANFKAVYVIMAYSFNSKWIDVEKDRYINKKEILATMIAESLISISDEEIENIIYNRDEVLMDCINLYIESQKNSDFTAIIALTEHIALCNKMAMRSNDVSDKNLNDRTKYLGEINECEKRLEELKDRIQHQYRNIDEVMLKEGRTSISKDIDLTIYENRLQARLSKK